MTGTTESKNVEEIARGLTKAQRHAVKFFAERHHNHTPKPSFTMASRLWDLRLYDWGCDNLLGWSNRKGDLTPLGRAVASQLSNPSEKKPND